MAATRNFGPPPEILAKAIAHFKEQEAKGARFVERYGHARVPVCTKMGDKWLIAVGGGLYHQTQAGPYNFVNALHDYALHFFGIPFLEAEERKPLAERHPAMQWVHRCIAHEESLRAAGNTDPLACQTGSGAAWFRLAYDLFTIGDNARLEARLRERLLAPKSFQAARHELKIAALCVVAGFELQFEDEQDASRRHPEFIASDRFSAAKIAVEVKSRHRRGVQGFDGGLDMQPGDHVDIRQPVLEAYRKASPLPFYVFVDTNLPPVREDLVWERWMREIDQTMTDLAAEGYADPCPANMILFTNDCSHYLLDEQIGSNSDRLWIKHYEAQWPRVPHPGNGMAARLVRAHAQRLAPPADFADFPLY